MLRERQGRSGQLAAVAGIALGSAVTFGLQQSGSQGELVAQATLAPIEDSGYQGSATVEQVDGKAVLVVSVPDLPSVTDGYYEVWMATADAGTMVAVGTLNPGEEAVLTLPAGMQAADFPLVDVSLEHYDGDADRKSVV